MKLESLFMMTKVTNFNLSFVLYCFILKNLPDDMLAAGFCL